MLQKIKVGFFRHFYRFRTNREWRAVRPSVDVIETTLNTRAGNLSARRYLGANPKQRPVVVYFHGGGWVIGDLKTHDTYCRLLAQQSGATVVSVEYRLAPEAVFPAAQEDCLDATRDIALRAAEFAGNGKLVLAGDSAGGHLSLMTALAIDAELRAQLAGIIATYPVADHYSAEYGSYEELASGQALTRDLMVWFWDTYLGSAAPDGATLDRAAPLRSEALDSLPPVICCTAGRDPLRDEGIALREALQAAGVAVEYAHYPESEHGFACSMGPTDDFNDWLERCAVWLAKLG